MRFIKGHTPKAPIADPSCNPNPGGLCLCGCGQKTQIAKYNFPARNWVKGYPRPFANGHHLQEKAIDRLWRQIVKDPITGCWNWTGASNRYGYGRMSVFGKRTLTHRLSWEYHYGPIPSGMNILHKCDNPACCNPEHLFIGTQQDNIADMHQKGRDRSLSGESSAKARLSAEQVRQIRSMYASGVSPSAIGDQFGIKRCHVCNIAKRRIWTSVE